MTTKIHLQNLKVEALIGLREHEREAPQELIIDLTLDYYDDKSFLEDEIGSELDYSILTKTIIEWAKQSSYFLLEAFVHNLAYDLYETFPIEKIELKVTKPRALNGQALVSISTQYPS